jgi:hypothetical protein
VLGDEPFDGGVVSHQLLERELAVEARGEYDRDRCGNDDERQEAPKTVGTVHHLGIWAGFGGH